MPRGSKSYLFSERGPKPRNNPDIIPLSRACQKYKLSQADMYIYGLPMQRASGFGNRGYTVRISDVVDLKKRIEAAEEKAKKELEAQKKEDEKNAIIEKYGQDHYDNLLAEEERKATVKKLVGDIQKALAASFPHGMAETLEGMTISKTNAKKDWYITDEEVENLTPIDPSKKAKKYHLSDVIAAGIRFGQSIDKKSLTDRIANHPAKRQLYARYLLDQFSKNCQTLDEASRSEIQNLSRTSISDKIEEKKRELDAATKTIGVLDGIVGFAMASKSTSTSTSQHTTAAQGAVVTPAKAMNAKRAVPNEKEIDSATSIARKRQKNENQTLSTSTGVCEN